MERQRRGWIEVICGPMFSGKTEELIRRVNRARLAGLKTLIFKPVIDDRYDVRNIVSHTRQSVDAHPVRTSSEILGIYRGEDVVAVDEGQFFDEGLVGVATTLANHGVRVIIAGLDMDFRGKPFGIMPYLMAIAEKVTKLQAVCMYCGGDASYSFKKVSEPALIDVGGEEKYIPLCRECYNENAERALSH